MGKYEKYLNECIIINDMSPADINHIEDGQATDRLDYFLDNYTYEDLKKHGISVMSAFCEIT